MHSRGLYLQTEDESTVEILMVDIEGKENKTEPVSPSDDLVRVLEYDYSEYRSGIRKLRDEHPLLEESMDVSSLDYEDFLAAAFELPERIKEFDPVGYFVVLSRLASVLRIPDDNCASFLLNNAQRILHALEEPLLTQIRLRNIFEVGFADMERATQRERYAAVREAYPQLFQHYFLVRYLPTEEGDMPFGKRKEYVVQSLFELRLLELDMYFRQPKRIARCLHCWNYFIPRTNRETLYCDRVFDGRDCKTLGPLAQRRIDQHNDNALAVFEMLRHRMASRAERFRDGGEDRDRLANHERLKDWNRRLMTGETLCYSVATVNTIDRERAEAAVIYRHKPPCNVEYINRFPFENTHIETSGRNCFLEAAFTVCTKR